MQASASDNQPAEAGGEALAAAALAAGTVHRSAGGATGAEVQAADPVAVAARGQSRFRLRR